jgi:phosphatidylserine/phosphatidylglycerophosphate/cardiolipin synthase-like enzyme
VGEILRRLEQRPPGGRTVEMILRSNFLYHYFQDATAPPSHRSTETFSIDHEAKIRIEESTWYRWLWTWGTKVGMDLSPKLLGDGSKRTEARNRTIKRLGVIRDLLSTVEPTSSQNRVLHGSKLKSSISEMLRDTDKELSIAGVVVDTTMVDEISDVQRRGANVRLILAPIEKLSGPRKRERRTITGAVDQLLKSGVQIKQHSDAHARFVVSDDSAIVGSTDLDNYGLNVYQNVSLLTKNPVVVEGLTVFFEELWSQSSDVSLT